MSSAQLPSSSLLKHFETLEDPHTAYLIEHLLLDIVVLTICAVICSAEGWENIEAYGRSKLEWLETFLSLPNGILSHDTISRVFARLEPSQLQKCFISWVKTIAQIGEGEVIAIDGKSARHSYDKDKGQGTIHMVSAWASQNRLVFGQVKVADKSNEITAIPKLLNILDVQGCIVLLHEYYETLDAQGFSIIFTNEKPLVYKTSEIFVQQSHTNL